MIHPRLFCAAVLALLPLGALAQGCLETPGLGALRTEHLDRVNAIRARHGLSDLDANIQLDAVAQNYACLLASTGHFDHTGPDGSSPWDRIRRGGYEYCAAAENLAAGQQSLLEAIVGWVRSPGHYRNLLEPSVVDVGFGAAYADPDAPPGVAPGHGASPPKTLGDLVRSFGAEELPLRSGRQNYLWVQVFAAPCDAE